MRASGIEIVGKIPWGTHFCVFYKSPKDLSETLAPYFRAGLENNEYCMCVTSEPLNIKDVETVMNKAIPNFKNYIRNHQFEIIPYTKWYKLNNEFNSERVLNGWVKKLENALHQGYDGLRLTGNTFWLENQDWKSFLDYEAEINKIITSYNMIAICSYSLIKCGSFEIIDVVQTHQFALIRQDGNWKLFKSAEQIRVEEELKKSIEALEKLNQMKDEFYTDISHEYRTPLTAIKGYSELLLQSNNLNKSQKEDLHAILRNEMRLEQLANEIIEYSRLRSGHVQFQKDKFRVSDICKDIKEEFEVPLNKKQLVLGAEYTSDEEIVLDRVQITRVLKNLLSNAIKFSFPNGKIIIQSILKNNIWRFSIQDFGIGIVKEDIPKMFIRFIKLNQSKEMNRNSIGIGLAICKNIINKYGGRIWVESDGLNKGTTISFEVNLNNR